MIVCAQQKAAEVRATSSLFALCKPPFCDVVLHLGVHFFYFLLFLQSGVLSALVCFKVPTLIIFYLSLTHHSLLLLVLFLLCTEEGFGGVYLVLITNSYLQSFGDQRDFKRGTGVSCRSRRTSRRTTHSRAWPKLMRGENSNEEHQCRM